MGDVVLVIEPDIPRRHWKLGQIEAVYPGRDGLVCKRFAARSFTGTLEQFFSYCHENLMEHWNNFFMFNVGFSKKKDKSKKSRGIVGFSNHCKSRRGKMLKIIFFRDTGNSFSGSYA